MGREWGLASMSLLQTLLGATGSDSEHARGRLAMNYEVWIEIIQ